MLARLKSEFAYASGIVRALSRTRRVVATPGRTVGDYLESWAKDYGERPALVGASESFTYRELDERANRYARWALARGLRKGDAVCLMMSNRPEYAAIWMGLARVGVATALINTNLTGPSLAHCVAIIAAKAAIVEASLMPHWAGARERLEAGLAVFVHGEAASGEPRIDDEVNTFGEGPLAAHERPALTIDDGALFIYTSGTTGLPKAARITHSRVLRIMLGFAAAANAAARRPGIQLPADVPFQRRRDRRRRRAFGRRLVLHPPALLRQRLLERRDSTRLHAVHLRRRIVPLSSQCAAEPAGPRHQIRRGVGNGLRPDIFAAFQSRFGIRDVLEFYAATEGNVVLFNFNSQPGAVGRLQCSVVVLRSGSSCSAMAACSPWPTTKPSPPWKSRGPRCRA